MYNTTRKNISFFMLLILCIVSIVGISANTLSNQSILANASEDAKFSFEMIQTRIDIDGYGNITNVSDASSDWINMGEISEGDFVLIDNTDARNDVLSKIDVASYSTTGIVTQGVHISFGLESDFSLLNITATLNGRPIEIAEYTDSVYEQTFFGLPYEICYSTQTDELIPIFNPEGEYVFTYRYMPVVGKQVSKTFSFRLISQANYESTIIDDEPTSTNYIYNTFQNENDYIIPSTIQTAEHYFNYNNFSTSTFNSESLQFPTLKYDATKFLLSWKKKLQNHTYTTTSSLTVNKNNSAIVTYTTTYNGQSSTYSIELEDITINPFIEVEFDEIGLYEFEFQYIVLNGTNVLVSTNLTNLTKTLEIFGYQLKYALNKSGSAELKNDEMNIYGDISFLNESYLSVNPSISSRNVANLAFYNQAGKNIFDYIPKTDQAPLWFDFLGSLADGNAVSRIYKIENPTKLKLEIKTKQNELNALLQSGTITESQYIETMNDYFISRIESYFVANYDAITEYTKNQFIDSDGLYFVEINYRNSNFNSLFSQLFAFEIEHISPVVKIIGLDEEENIELSNGQYTNLNVNVDWAIESPFNAEIYATYSLYDYNYNPIANYSNIPLRALNTGNPTTLSQNGIYEINVHYGNSIYSYSTYDFIIDKNPIADLKYKINQGADVGYNMDITEALSSLPILNENFVLSFSEKESGAEIIAEYQFLPIIEDSTYTINEQSNLIEIDSNYYLKNGWTTSELSSILNFYNNSTIFSSQGIYLFHIFDTAGNETYSYVVLESTNPSMIFNPSINNVYNIIDSDTAVSVGTHKAITLDYDINNIYFEYFKDSANFNNELFDFDLSLLTVPLSSRTMKVGQSKVECLASTEQNITQSTITLTIPNELDEYYYYISLTDSSRIRDRLGLVNSVASGKTATIVEYNIDKSQVKIKAKSSETESVFDGGIRIYNYYATNQDLVYVEYYGQRDEYIVEEIYYDFYPLTLDTNSANYPYSETPSIEKENLTSYRTNGDAIITNEINPIFSQKRNKLVTAEGLYVVTRIYKASGDLEGASLEKRTKKYAFMVDRIRPIDKVTVDYPLSNTTNAFERIVGEFISLVLGKDSHTMIEFNDFLLSNQSDEQVILSTDILPIQSKIPFNKYIVLNEAGEIQNQEILGLLASFNLNVDIFYISTSNKEKIQIKSTYTYINGQTYLQIDPNDFRKIGKYQFVLKDTSGYDEYINNVLSSVNVGANQFKFTIEVKKEFPTANFYGTPNIGGTDKIIQSTSSGLFNNVSSTNDENLSLVFFDSVDPYKAKIEHTDILVSRKTKNATSFEQAVKITCRDYDSAISYPKSTDMTSLSDAICIRSVQKDSDDNILHDKNGNVIYKFTVVLPTQTQSGNLYEGEYQITLHYYGDKIDYWNNYYYDYNSEEGAINYYSNLSGQLNIVLDHTAPNFNLIRLVNLDRYIPTTSNDINVITKSDIYNYAKGTMQNIERRKLVRQFLRTYSFRMPNDFVLRYATNVDFPISDNFMLYTYPLHDTSLVYFRKYDKYTNTQNAEQSYIISDPEYSDVTKTRFEQASSEYESYSYSMTSSSQSFAKYVLNKTSGYNGVGYYEIIEIDQAGNQTVYTVYVSDAETNLTFVNTLSGQEYSLDAEDNTLSAGYEINLSEINNLDTWTKIAVYDLNSTTKRLLNEFDITYETELSNIIVQINTLIAEKAIYKDTGAKYEIVVLNRVNENEDISIYIQRPGQRLGYQIEEGRITFELQLPTSTASTWLIDFQIYEYNSRTNTLERQTQDLSGKEIGVGELSGATYTFSSGEYYFYMIDNFERGYTEPVHYIFGIPDIKTLSFSGKVEYNSNNTPVTASDTTFTYQERLYNVEVSRNGTSVDWQNDANIIVSSNSVNKTKSLKFLKIQNELVEYIITIYQLTSGLEIEIEPYVQTFIMDTRLPNFELTDQNGNNMNYLINSTGASTSKELFISWANIDGYPIIVTVHYEFNDKSQTINIAKGDSIWLEGSYTLTMSSTLGHSISYSFAISQISSVLFDVYSNNTVLSPSKLAQHFDISNVTYDNQTLDISADMKVYLSIYDCQVVANEQKDLQARKILETSPSQAYTLQIWQIYGNTSLYFEEYIAVVILNPDYLVLSDFVIGDSEETIATPSGLSATYYNATVYIQYNPTLTMALEYATENLVIENFVYLELYYNNLYVDKYENSNFAFTETGNYKLYFSDIAGKKYTFRYSSTNIANYYSIDIYNSISYLINGAEPIQNAIFNEDVNLSIVNLSIYKQNSFGISILLNGENMPEKNYLTKTGWTFTGYGMWQIVMTAQYGSVPITTTYTFTILSNKEARSTYSFAKMNGYEIISVYQNSDTNNITQELKNKQKTDKLSELYLSNALQDYGKYYITVAVKTSQYKPTLTFTYSIWLNSYQPELISSIPFGGETKANITISLNYYAIYNEIGNFKLKITGMNDILINSETVGENKISSVQLTENRVYYVQIWSESGTLVTSYKVTKLEPLNTIAIIIIVSAILLMLLLIFLFIKLRTKMKVR